MKRIIIHWSAGCYQPNFVDFEHYHYLITGDGLIIEGKYKPEDNLNCKDEKYAHHTQMGNTASIGVAFCAMAGFKSKNNAGKYPLKEKQCEAGFKFIAELCKKYSIEINSKNVLTHYEFDKNRGLKGRKIDIICIPYLDLKVDEIGDYIRNKVLWYKNKQK